MKPKAKILVVDDEPGLRDWLSFELSQQGYLVTTAVNGVDGLEKIKREKFNIAIIDIMMPEMDGITFVGHLKQIDPDIEAIMTTGYGTMESAIESLRKGAYDYINKPFSVDDISLVVEKALEKQQLKESVALYEISKAIFSTIEFDQLLKIIIDLTTVVMKSDDTALLLFDEKKKLSVAAASFELTDEDKVKTCLAVCEQLVGRNRSEWQPTIATDNLVKDSRFRDLKRLPEIKSALILPLAGKRHPLGILNLNRLQGNDYYTENDLSKARIFASQIALAVDNAYMYKELNALYMSTIRSLANAIDAKDHYTNRHSEHVSELAVKIAQEMGLTGPEIQRVQQAAQIHDLGKIGIRDAIINKKERLSALELEEIRSHPLKGAQILEPFGFLHDIVEIIKQHHEWVDGTGYPLGLKIDTIRLEARIIAVADAYDAMTSDRPYRKALTRKEALDELVKFSDTQFDNQVIAALLKLEAM